MLLGDCNYRSDEVAGEIRRGLAGAGNDVRVVVAAVGVNVRPDNCSLD